MFVKACPTGRNNAARQAPCRDAAVLDVLLAVCLQLIQLLDGVLGAGTDHSALKEYRLRGLEDKHQVFRFVLLCLLGCVIEDAAAILVWQGLDKGDKRSSPAWPTSPSRISWPSSQRIFLSSLRWENITFLCFFTSSGVNGLHPCMPLNTLMTLSQTAALRPCFQR